MNDWSGKVVMGCCLLFVGRLCWIMRKSACERQISVV
jgi:hypothetical protein